MPGEDEQNTSHGANEDSDGPKDTSLNHVDGDSDNGAEVQGNEGSSTKECSRDGQQGESVGQPFLDTHGLYKMPLSEGSMHDFQVCAYSSGRAFA